MKRQALIIGLGQFGLSLSRTLSERGVEVLAVDILEERVRLAANFVTEAVRFDASDAQSLAKTAPDRREIAVCAIGDDSQEASILCTALLKQMGAPRIIARAEDELHARILMMVGAHQVVNPEREYGERFASQILNKQILNELPLGEDLLVTEFQAPESFWGRTLQGLNLPKEIIVVAIRDSATGTITLPNPVDPIQEKHRLLVVSKQGFIAKLLEKV